MFLILADCLHGVLPAPSLMSKSVFVFSFSLIFFLCRALDYISWPFRHLLSARKYIVSYRIC